MSDYREELNVPQGSPPPDERKQNGNGTMALIPVGIEMPTKADRLISHSDIAVLDTARFDQMYRVATLMAQSTVVDHSLRGYNDNDDWKPYPPHTVVANCFQVVSLAERWKFDPYALLACLSIVNGKFCFEGKVLHAAIEQCVGIRLEYDFVNEDNGDQLGVVVSGTFPNEAEAREIEGTVAGWQKGPKSPWAKPTDWKRQLRYRGAREWCRAHSPGVILGVYSADEMDEVPAREAEPKAAPEPKPVPPTTPPPRRTAIIDKAGPATLPCDAPPVVAAPPVTEPPRRIAVEGKSNKPKAKTSAEAVPDKHEREWLDEFATDLAECRNAKAITMLKNRRENAINHLSPAGKARAEEIVTAALSEVQR